MVFEQMFGGILKIKSLFVDFIISDVQNCGDKVISTR
jgi:hypothetical protein